MPDAVGNRALRRGAKPAGVVVGYDRVLREGQDLAQQRARLRAAGCTRVFEENGVSGRWDRPELHRLLECLRPGDVVVVWKLDRISQSLTELLHIVRKIGEAGAGFRAITERIDTTISAGRMLMRMVGALEHFEEAMIRERTTRAPTATKAEERGRGRPRKLDDAKRREIAEAVLSGRTSAAAMAWIFGVAPSTVSRIVSSHVVGQARL
jgi:DNA invertase Pin-like site-specific DNA recombinase